MAMTQAEALQKLTFHSAFAQFGPNDIKEMALALRALISNEFGVGDVSSSELLVLDGVTAGTALASKALVLDSAGGIGAVWRDTRATGIFKQVAPAAKTTATTLTAAELLSGLLTANQGGAAAANYTLPLATALETALLVTNPGLANDDAFDFTLLNISTVAAEDITVATNTGWTLVGKMTVESNAAVTDNSFGIFRARRTAANTYTLYRVA